MPNFIFNIQKENIIKNSQQIQIVSIITLLIIIFTLPLILLQVGNSQNSQSINSLAAAPASGNAATYCPVKADVMLVIDDSNSMQENDSGNTKIKRAMTGALSLIDNVSKNNNINLLGISLFSYTTKTSILSPLQDPRVASVPTGCGQHNCLTNGQVMKQTINGLYRDQFEPKTYKGIKKGYPYSCTKLPNGKKANGNGWVCDTYTTNDGTDLVKAEQQADQMLSVYDTGAKKGQARNDGAKHFVFLLTDGKPNIAADGKYDGTGKNDTQAAKDGLNEVKKYNGKVYYFTIGYGSPGNNLNSSYLKNIAKASGNPYGQDAYTNLTNGSQLSSILSKITQEICTLPTPTPTKLPTPTPTKKLTPTPTPTKKLTPTPTPTLTPHSTVVSLSLNLQGVFVGPQTGTGYKINNDPLTPARAIKLEFFKPNADTSTATPTATATSYVQFNTTSGLFVNSNIPLSTSFNAGNYKVIVITGRYLRKSLGVVNIKTNITNGLQNNLTPSTANLIVGDINQDNKLDLKDFDDLAACFPNTTYNSTWCSSSSDQLKADLNDLHSPQGNNWNDEMNLLLENFATQTGD